MVDEGMNANVDNSQPEKELSPGEMLLQARLKAGLTQEQVAKDLYMTVYKVKALETDDYKRLNSDTFARGYIRAYANLVKLDVVAVLTAYDKLMDELRPQPVLQTQTVAAEPGHRGAWHFLVVIGAFFLGLWLISVWFFDNHSEVQYTVAPDRVSSASATESLADAVPESESAPFTSDASKTELSSSSAGMVADEAEKSEARSVSASSVNDLSQTNVASAVISSMESTSAKEQSSSAAIKKATLDELNFSFRGESWLEVSDSRGDVLATELQPSGSQLKLVGRAPFNVKLGNAPAVDVQLNGKKIDVIPLMGSNVLIMKIDN